MYLVSEEDKSWTQFARSGWVDRKQLLKESVLIGCGHACELNQTINIVFVFVWVFLHHHKQWTSGGCMLLDQWWVHVAGPVVGACC